MIDIQNIRKDTPGIQHVTHFNNAGASLVSREVLEAQVEYLREEAARGGYETALRYHDKLEAFYNEAAKLIGAHPDEIAFTESATVAWQRAFFSIPLQKGDNILTSKAEYASNFISYLYLKEEKGINIRIIPSNAEGEVDLHQLESSIDEHTRLVSITHIPTNGGLMNPAEEIGEIVKKYNLLYLLDACQSVGQYPVDVEKIGCHFLSTTGRKYLRGPRGTGFLYVKKDVQRLLRPNSLDLHSAEWVSPQAYKMQNNARMFETWESNLAGKLAFTAAIRKVNELGIHRIWERITLLADYLRARLEGIGTVEVHDLGREKCGIVTFTAAMPAADLKKELHKRSFNTSISEKGSTLLDMEDRHLIELVRASVHYYNTTEEIDNLVKNIKEILR